VIKCSVKCASKNAFQVKDSAPDWSYYGPRKVKFNPFLVIHLQGCFLDFVMHGAGWLNVQTGMSQVTVEPHGNCFCGVKEATTSAGPECRRMDQKVSTFLSTVAWLHVEAGSQSLVEWSCVCVCVCVYTCADIILSVVVIVFLILYWFTTASVLLVCKPFCLCDTHKMYVMVCIMQ
jgi:hypothetical protein